MFWFLSKVEIVKVQLNMMIIPIIINIGPIYEFISFKLKFEKLDIKN